MDAINGIRNHVVQPALRPPGGLDRSEALNILDEFWLSPYATPLQVMPEPPHGMKVQAAALDAGFQGKINCIQNSANPLLLVQKQAEIELRFGDLEARQARRVLEIYVQSQSMAAMMCVGSELDAQVQGGTHGAVTNISFGGGPATATLQIYEQARLCWAADGQQVNPWAPRLLHNLARALEVAAECLVAPDPEVNGPARARFQQDLVSFTTRAYQAQVVQDARTDYAQKVIDYEALGNSVVISAGNEGELLADMKRDNGGRDVPLPVGFFEKALGTAETTCVGALGFAEDNSPKVAEYSTGGDSVSIVAWGRAFDGQPGTSFAAPRVAAAMQRIHQEYPAMSSAEVERRMLEMQTVPVEGTRALLL